MRGELLCEFIERLKGRKRGCIHNPNLPSTSLEIVNKRNMTFPQFYVFECKKCGKIFNFVKNCEDLFQKY